MAKIGYFATYARFDTVDKEAAAAFLGADNIVGDTFTVDHEITPDSNKAWIVNPFGKKMGYLSPKVAEQVDLCKAKGWNTVAILALVAFSEQPEPGLYWGEVVIISYDPAYESAFSTFVEGIRKQISKGVRPKVKLGPDSLQKIIDTQGAWLKTERSGTEALVEQARKGNIGCTIASWIFLLALVALLVFGLHSCGLF